MSEDKKSPPVPPDIASAAQAMVKGDRIIPDEEALDIGVAAESEAVILRFSRPVHWCDLTPENAVDIAEALITAAGHAAHFRAQNQKIVVPGNGDGKPI
jgi:hypothetical protein